MPISNIYKPITTTNPGILGLNKKVKIGSTGRVEPIDTQQSTPVGDSLNSNGGGSYTAPQVQSQGFSPITNTPSTSNKGLFNNVKSSVSPAVAQPQTTFGGLVSGIQNASNPSSSQSGYVRKIERVGAQNQALGQKAEDLSKKYGEEIARIGELGAGAVAGNLSTGTNVVGAGNAAIASQSASSRMNALAQGQNAELSGIEKQLAANAAERAALESSLGGSQFQQTAQLGGLGSAAGLAAPSGNYPFTFDPLTASFGQSGTGAILNPQQAAQDVISGKTGYEQAKAALSYLGGTGEAQLQAAITAAGGDPLRLQAQGAATAQNIGTQNTAGTDIARQGLGEATNAYNQASTAFQTTELQGANLQNAMKGVNALDARFANTQINKLKNQFGNAKYTEFLTALNEARQAYTNLLSSVGAATPTVNGVQADQILGESATPAQINAAITQLNNAAYAKLLPMYNLMQTYQQNLGGGQSYGGGGYSGGGSSGGGLYSF